nr:MAG TPA: hypothetical protein [Caudoviricetes sp.]
MTSKEFACNYAGKEFMFYGEIVILVGYDSECPDVVIVSPVDLRTRGCFWEGLDNTDVITYTITYVTNHRIKGATYQYARIEELEAAPDAKPMSPGECIAYYGGQQGMNYSVVNGCVSAVYKRQGSALKLVSRGDGINNVTEKI